MKLQYKYLSLSLIIGLFLWPLVAFGQDGEHFEFREDGMYPGRYSTNPIEIRGDSMGFEISDTVNTFYWSLHKFYPETVHYKLHLERSMPILITTVGSEIRHTSVTLKYISESNDTVPLPSKDIRTSYFETLFDADAWDFQTCNPAQEGFYFVFDTIRAGDYMVEVHGVYTQEEGTSNGPITTTFFGLFAKYSLYTPIPGFLLNGMPYRPHPLTIPLFADKSTRIVTEKTLSREYLMARREMVDKVYFEVEVPTTLDVTFSTRGYGTILSVTGGSLGTDTLVCGKQRRQSVRLSAGKYLIGAKDSIKNNIGTKLGFTIESELPPDWLKHVVTDSIVACSNHFTTRTYLTADSTQFVDNRRYFDGLGRPALDVEIEASPLGNDIATLIEYDILGREYRKWLPGLSDGGYVTADKIDRTSVYGSNRKPYQETVYDGTPLNRVKAQYGAGSQWYDDSKAVTHDYDIALSSKSAHSVFHYTVEDTPDIQGRWPAISCAGRYADCELEVHTVVDEDDRVVIEFTDARGNQILSRKDMKDGTWADTYYIYDSYNNLTAVLSPEAAARMAYTGNWQSSNDDTLISLAYLYRYDRRGNVVARRIPGSAVEEFKYDVTGHRIFSRDGNLLKRNLWRFEINDVLGRVCLVGLCRGVEYEGRTLPSVRAVRNSGNDSGSTMMGYEIRGCSLKEPQVLEAFYYDDYSFVGEHGFPDSATFGFRDSSGFGTLYHDAQGLSTGHAVALIGHDTDSLTHTGASYLYSVDYYDSRDRVIQSVSTNVLGGVDRVLTAYDFAGRPVMTESIHSAPDYGYDEIVNQWQRSYDKRGRELMVDHRPGRQGEWHTVSSKSYDSIGRLSTDNRGEAVSLGYSYDIRSRLTAIKSPYYNQTLDYTYGGNVSRMSWRAYCPDDAERTYRYSYDGLGRIVAADYSDTQGRDGAYSTAYSYDLNGNVLTLWRHGIHDRNSYGHVYYGMIDDLTLEYEGNRLQRVSDLCTGPYFQGAYHFVDGADETVEYTYDANGNTDADLNRGIAHTTYDLNNRPQQVEFADGSLTTYLYDASGQKWRTTHDVAQLPVAMPSIGTSEGMLRRSVTDYCGPFVYEDSVLTRINFDGGYLSYTDYSGSHLAEPEYHFYLTDHLGNNRVDIADYGGVWQAMDYYPFGMPMASSYLPGKQRWLFGGKELDRTSGLDLYDQDARAYDPTLGRFRNPDPFAEKYHPISPYLFCAANPLLYVDPDGAQVLILPSSTPLISSGSTILMTGRATPIMSTRAVRSIPKSESHHIIPRQVKGEAIVDKAIKQGFKFDGKGNRITLEKFSKSSNSGRHGNHPKYNEAVKKMLRNVAKNEKNGNDETAIEQLNRVVSKIRDQIINNPEVKINDLKIEQIVCPIDNLKRIVPVVVDVRINKSNTNFKRN